MVAPCFIADIVRTGPIEDDLAVVAQQNLEIYQRAERARKRVSAINTSWRDRPVYFPCSTCVFQMKSVRSNKLQRNRPGRNWARIGIERLGDMSRSSSCSMNYPSRILDGMLDRDLKRLLLRED